jgi:large subunit ribosomal protein L15
MSPPPGSRKVRRRVGRGVGSGNGKTSGLGQKGQKARSGGNVPPGFEGGQMPIHRRLPKTGFTNIFSEKFFAVNLRDLGGFAAGARVDVSALVAGGLARSGRKVKILGSGSLDKALHVRAHAFSETAKAAIEALGGSVEVIGG